MKNKSSKKKPFFATFLEKQIKDPKAVTGGGLITIPERDGITEPGGETVTLPEHDIAHTMKYPSDGDDDLPTV
ncbi:hypothetical protein M2347_000176 [Chryseobacterium sp. H1D6B]|uniref:microviridin/marinostatin family tricyclic proteinase inhibitor n=1 Tax=Chryseobacterium sp. H1D6B TaxID=2940588 RepID=UPI0015C79850|nr:microviridin/marinostatin family tricyclic proteinase inhibitor [Chryseobacterium sp. H1D6B]MDH6250449.1 hypothetical protein [Chryseobacterium sp. H1D6B]